MMTVTRYADTWYHDVIVYILQALTSKVCWIVCITCLRESQPTRTNVTKVLDILLSDILLHTSISEDELHKHIF